MCPPEVNWLLVEDNADDAFLFRHAVNRAFDQPPRLRHVQDGAAAVVFLDGSATLPTLIVSDLNMPRLNGLELLTWVRSHPAFGGLPFVMLTSSNSPQDREAALRLGVDDYLVKPSQIGDLVKQVRGIQHQNLLSAERHLREQEQRVVRHVELVNGLVRAGCDSALAEQTLRVAERLLEGLKKNYEFLKHHYKA